MLNQHGEVTTPDEHQFTRIPLTETTSSFRPYNDQYPFSEQAKVPHLRTENDNTYYLCIKNGEPVANTLLSSDDTTSDT